MIRSLLIRRGLVVAGFVVAMMVGTAGPAAAHAELRFTDPTTGSVLDSAPDEIVLRFSEPIDPTDDSIRLLDADGVRIELGPITQPLGSDSLVAAVPDQLDDGSYVVAWWVVSADSHPIGGAYVFSVGSPSADSAALAGAVVGGVGAEPGGTGWLSFGRFAGYTGIAVLTGTLAASALLAPALLHRRRLGVVLTASGCLAIAGTAVMISAQADQIGASFLDWSAVGSTRAGGWWLARLAVLMMLTAPATALIFGGKPSAPDATSGVTRRRWNRLLMGRAAPLVAVVVSIGLFAVTAAGGHAVSGRWREVAFGATVLHVGAMAFWIGGIVVLLLLPERHAVGITAARFSPLALAAVVVLAATGSLNGWRQLRSTDALIDTSYGRWLMVKLAVITLVVIVATVARRTIRRAPSVDAGPRLRPILVVEAVGMVVVLAATAGLAAATPPRPDLPAPPANVTITAATDDQTAHIELMPAVTGGTTLLVAISGPTGDREAPEEITVTAALADQELGPIDIPVSPAGAGRVSSDSADFAIPGRWTITVTARYGEFDQRVFTTVVDITGRP